MDTCAFTCTDDSIKLTFFAILCDVVNAFAFVAYLCARTCVTP
jgi:hypothetical protein